MTLSIGVRLSEMQLFDPIGYRAWCNMVERRVDAKVDATFVHGLEAEMTGTRGSDKETPSVLYARHAAGFLKELIAALATGEMDTRDAVLWLFFEQAMTCCSRLVAFRDVDLGDGIDAESLVKAICAYMGVAARTSDMTDRATLLSELSDGSVSDSWLEEQGMRIYTDVCCGRAAVWIAYCRHMGAIAIGHDGYMRLREAQAVAQANSFVKAAEQAFEWGDVHATGAYAVEAQATASVLFAIARGRWLAISGDEVPLADANWTTPDVFSTFGLVPLECACMLPASLQRSMTDELAKASRNLVTSNAPVRLDVDHGDSAPAFRASLF